MKMWNYVVISVFLALIFEMAGIPVGESLLPRLGIDLETGTAGLLGSEFWTALVALLAISFVGSIIAGFVTKITTENIIIIGFVASQIIIFSSVMLGILSTAEDMGGWIFYITLLIIAPLAVGFGVAAYEHFRGTD